jgi:hypothetical protein
MKSTYRWTRRAVAAFVLLASVAGAARAHDGDVPSSGPVTPVTPATLAQLEAVRSATARFRDVHEAEHAGYADIGLFIPHMGWHYLNLKLLDGTFDPTAPQLLVYADDPCGGPRRLVAVEYAVPLADSANAPAGFVGNADRWDVNVDFGLWTLHAWVFEYNAAGVFAPFNQQVPAQ